MQRGGRDAQIDRFVDSMDLRFDRSKLDSYFSTVSTASSDPPDTAGRSQPQAGGFDFSSVDLEEQRKLWDATASSFTGETTNDTRQDPAANDATAMPAVDGMSALREILGTTLSESAMEGLLRATKGCPDRAVGLYFSSLGTGKEAESSQGQSRGLDLRWQEKGPSVPKGCLAGCCVVVKGLDWKLLPSKTQIEARLKELGAIVKQRVTKETTHVLVPENQPIGTVSKCGDTTVVRESWLVGHVRAGQAKKEVIDLSCPSPSKPNCIRQKKKKRTKASVETKSGPAEKRTRRLRQATPAVEERVRRSLSERMLLVRRGPSRAQNGCHAEGEEFCVMGTTGNLYDVTIDREVSCTCVDSGKGHQCKHILFIMLRVLRVERSSYLIYQRGLLSSELQTILRDNSTTSTTGTLLANAAVRETLDSIRGPQEGMAPGQSSLKTNGSKVKRKPVEADDRCGICFETLHNPEAVEDTVWCQFGCGRTLHQSCMHRWAKMQLLLTETRSAKCPYCRIEWQQDCPSLPQADEDREAHMGERQDEGFVNLGSLEGMRTTRDESTYSEWFRGR